MNIKAAIFDLDGVIVHTSHLHYKAWQKLANTLDIDIDETKNEELKGIGRMGTLEKILSWGGINLSDKEKHVLAELKNSWYQEYLHSINSENALPGVLSFISDLKSDGIKIGLGSSSMNARMIMDRMDITDLFDVVVDGNMIINGKPNSEIFLKGSNALHVEPYECIVFEDSIAGIDAAISGGFWTVGVGNRDVLGHAHWVIESFEDLNLEKFSSGVISRTDLVPSPNTN